MLEDTKKEVLDTKRNTRRCGRCGSGCSPLSEAAGQAFYNTSKFTLRDLRARANRQQLTADFTAYLDGFSSQRTGYPGELRVPQPDLQNSPSADALGTLIEKLTSSEINLSPDSHNEHRWYAVRRPGLDNHGMGTIFEELIRRFNEENNEEAGEHWTPRDAVRLMARLVFLPIADQIQSSTYLLYDGACGTGGMLTVAEDTLMRTSRRTRPAGFHPPVRPGDQCRNLRHLQGGPTAEGRWVTPPTTSWAAPNILPFLMTRFSSEDFDFMLSNPPYGKSWKTDLDRMGGKKEMSDPRFVIEHGGDPGYSLVTRSSDGQMLFLANKLIQDEAGHAAWQPHCRGAQRQFPLHRRRGTGREQHPQVDHRKRLAGGHRRPAAQNVLQYRNRDLRLGSHQPKTTASPRQGSTDRRNEVVSAVAKEPRKQELRTWRGRNHPNL